MLHSSRNHCVKMDKIVCMTALTCTPRARGGRLFHGLGELIFVLLLPNFYAIKTGSSGRQTFADQAGGHRQIGAVGGIPGIEAAMQRPGAVETVFEIGRAS